MQFEEHMIEALQGDKEVAACLNTYAEARRRLAEKNRNRGFWNVSSGGSKGFSKGKGKSKGKGFRKRKPLAQRILESECRRCGAQGHWKAECPLRNVPLQSQTHPKDSGGAFAGTVLIEGDDEDEDLLENLEIAPWLTQKKPGFVDQLCYHVTRETQTKGVLAEKSTLTPVRHVFQRLARVLQSQKPLQVSPQLKSPTPDRTRNLPEVSCFVSHGPFGIVDLGASQTVIGCSQMSRLFSLLPKNIQDRCKRVPCDTVFRFGNSSTTVCREALLVPLARWFIKICIVPSDTPFLISNNVFRKLGAVIDTGNDSVLFAKIGIEMTLTLSEKKLYLLDFCAFVSRCQDEAKQSATIETVLSISSGDDRVQKTVGDDDELMQHPNEFNECQSLSELKPCRQAQLSSTFEFSEHHGEPLQSERCDRSLRTISCPDDSSRNCGRESRVHEHELRRTGPDAHLVRGSQGEPNVPTSGDRGSSLCALVPTTIRPKSQDESPTTREVCSASCGTPREPTRPCNKFQGQSQSQELPRSGYSSSQGPGRRDGHGELQSRERGAESMGSDPSARRNIKPGDPGAHQWSSRGQLPAESEDRSHGECSLAHRSPPSATFDPSAGSRCEPDGGCESVLRGQHVDALRAEICEQVGMAQMMSQPTMLVDPEYFADLILQNSPRPNWVYDEMWQFWRKRFNFDQQDDVKAYLGISQSHLLEIYCSENSQLTFQASQMGLKAARFGLKQGDLSTFEGRTRLYEFLWIFKPSHLWLSPKCGPWSKWNRLNGQKSIALAQKILSDRVDENVHLLLSDALFRLQIWRGPECHFHLEQPKGSELVHQHEMQGIVRNTWRACCDMCVAGNLKHPETNRHLQQGTQIFTTSQIVCRMIEQNQCVGNHIHDVIQGSCRPQGLMRIPVTRYTELYTAAFGRKLSRAILCSIRNGEQGPQVETGEFCTAATTDEENPPKRRRLGQKTPEALAQNPDQRTLLKKGLIECIGEAERVTPRVGKVAISDGLLFDMIQRCFPEKQIVVVDCCRGIDRRRVSSEFVKGCCTIQICLW